MIIKTFSAFLILSRLRMQNSISFLLFKKDLISRNLKMTISRSLNFSLFQSSSSSNPKEEDLQEEEEDYDWGELLIYWTSRRGESHQSY